ncbi:hypothetical protein ACWKWU_01805 [Chitinophaga lutea]
MKLCVPALLLFVCLFSAGCRKNTKDDLSPQLQGTWELKYTTGMFGYKPFDAGNGTGYVFSGNNFTEMENGVAVKSGTYRTIGDRYTRTKKATTRLIFDNDPLTMESKLFIEINGNELQFGSDDAMMDGGVRVYTRVRSLGNGGGN